MPATVDISLLGDKRLQRKLERLVVAAQKRVIRSALRKGGHILRDEAKALCPVRTGALRKSIKVRAIKGKRATIGVVVASGTREELGLKAADYYYPAAVEFGTGNAPAHSFLRAARDAKRDEVIEVIKREIGEGITREARRG